ncbi:LrgB [Gordoniibacillus kamchatkensis]|uniref:LrgB n=1 Tax=Gordoniibacillus kamchatkensis TaxID=1590651 RepID=A0ABR5AFV2_9BACL|nr:LrgB family protein [Paenibacillus sp. VKM B-2647]KIL39861.1 LrgB [Paenibacillus sp. VKM B-2647]
MNFNDPLFGIVVTGLAYMAGLAVNRKWPAIHPLLVAAGGIIVFLAATGIPYEAYKVGGDWIEVLLGPATIALGVPFYKNMRRLRHSLAPLLASVSAGTAAGMASAACLVWALGGDRTLVPAMMAKSVTTPIAMDIARMLGGKPELAAVFAVITGLFGSVCGPAFLKLCGVRDDVSVAAAVGTAAHGIGTGRLVRESELRGSVSGLAMTIAGIAGSLFAAVLALIGG